VNRKSLLTGALAALALAACGGGGSDTAGIQGSGVTSPPPSASSTATVGTITGFGSVFVNSVEYNTSGAQITIDGQPGTEAQLEAGQIVTINGAINSDGTTGTAAQLAFVGDVQGSISQIDTTSNSFTVLGQTVVVTRGTLLDSSTQPGDLSGLQAGSIVEVSGFTTSTGQIVASRIATKPAGSTLQAKGAVQSLDTGTHTFHINALVVDYSSVSSVPTLSNGSVVVVQGNTLNGSGALVAASVTAFKGLGASANQHADIQGLITSITSADFFVNGQEVTTDSNTQTVLHGVTLGVNVAVRVTGTINAMGILQAQKVEAKQQGASALAGPVDSLSASDSTLSVLGVKVAVSSLTELDDKSQQHLKSFRFTDIHTGDYVEIAGAENPPGTVNAATLVRDKANNESVAQGVASNVAAPNLTVLGVQVVTTAQTKFSVPGPGADKATAFFAQAPNAVVTIKGKFSGGVLTADEAAIAH
jgi:hypothetical protein